MICQHKNPELLISENVDQFNVISSKTAFAEKSLIQQEAHPSHNFFILPETGLRSIRLLLFLFLSSNLIPEEMNFLPLQ